jgi:hypothetical protein
MSKIWPQEGTRKEPVGRLIREKLELGKNSGLDTRIDRLLQACIPVAEMGFPHPTQFGLGGPQLGLLPTHACRANNESLSLWDMPLKLWAEFAEVNAMDAF